MGEPIESDLTNEQVMCIVQSIKYLVDRAAAGLTGLVKFLCADNFKEANKLVRCYIGKMMRCPVGVGIVTKARVQEVNGGPRVMLTLQIGCLDLTFPADECYEWYEPANEPNIPCLLCGEARGCPCPCMAERVVNLNQVLIEEDQVQHA